MLEPYSDRPDQTGIMRTPEGAWIKLIDDFVRNVCIGLMKPQKVEADVRSLLSGMANGRYRSIPIGTNIDSLLNTVRRTHIALATEPIMSS
jgi:hypothetical protein